MNRRFILAFGVLAAALALPGVARLWPDDSGPEPATEAARVSTTSTNGLISAAEAVDFWGRRIADRPADHLSRTELANAYVRLARESGDVDAYGQAGEALDEALDINPDYQPAKLTLTQVYTADHRFGDALAVAESVLLHSPGQPAALAAKGDALLELGRYSEAEAVYDELLAAERSAPVLSRLGRLSYLRGRSVDAVEYATQALAAADELVIAPEGLAWFEFQLADVLLDVGDVAAADVHVQRALELAPKLPAALVMSARVHAMSGDLDAAATAYQSAIDILPEPEWLVSLADIHAARGDDAALADTLVALEAKAADRSPTLHERPLTRYEVAYGEPAEAVRLAEAELVGREDVYGYDTLAWALLAVGDVDGAVAAADRAVAEGTEDAGLLARMGEVYLAAGQVDEGVALLEAALAIHPNFDPLAASRAAALITEQA